MNIAYTVVRQSAFDQWDYNATDTDLCGVLEFLREAAENTFIEVETEIRTAYNESGEKFVDAIRIRFSENHFQTKEAQKLWWAGLRVPMKNMESLGYATNIIAADAYNEWKHGEGNFHTNRVYYFIKKKSISFFL